MPTIDIAPTQEYFLLTTLFKLVCNIPYGHVGKHDIEKMLTANKGSCSTKHILLGFLLEQNQFKVKYMMGKSNLRSLNPFLPKNLRLDHDIWDFHNFLIVTVDNKELVVDATFGLREQNKGFPSNINWNAKQDCTILFPVESMKEVSNLLDAKKQAISTLTDTDKDLRYHFFQRLINYLEQTDYLKKIEL